MVRYTQVAIYWITLLEATCIGVLMPILNTHIFTLNGNHKITGIIAALSILAESYSKTILGKSSQDPVIILRKYLLIELISNVMLGFTASIFVVGFARFLFNLVNQTGTLCKRIISKTVAAEELSPSYRIMHFLYIVGLIIGPIIGGHLYQNLRLLWPKICQTDACFQGITAALVSFNIVSLTLAYTMQPNETPENLTENEPQADPVKYPPSEIKALRFLSRVALWVFFSKFSLLIKELYSATAVQVGYTLSFQFFVFFGITFIVNSKINAFCPKKHENLNLFIGSTLLCISMVMVCLSHSFPTFLLNSVPLIFARVYVDWCYKCTFCDSRAMLRTYKLVDMLLPIVFGIFCDIYQNDAFRVFCILPLIVAVLLSIYYDSFINNIAAQTQIHLHDE